MEPSFRAMKPSIVMPTKAVHLNWKVIVASDSVGGWRVGISCRSPT